MARPAGNTTELWTAFHAVVNMPSGELRDWLAAAADPSTGAPADALDLGHRVAHVLSKRRGDLNDDDVETMDETVGRIMAMLEQPRRDDPSWRHELMALGHDPLRPDSPRRDELA